MSQLLYEFANAFFFIFHTALILFNVFGWIFRRTRIYNLYTLLLTVTSWFLLGIWYGWGYCLCTDWHWDIRRQLGYVDQTNSYIDLLIIKLTGIHFDDELIDTVSLVVLVVSLVFSIILNIRDFRSK